MQEVLNFIVIIAAVVMAIVCHEVAHGWAACKLGDDTAKLNGRLSLNPVRHADLFGSLLLPGFLILSHFPFVFGWAKPVPVDFSKLRNRRVGIVIVSSAGIIANFLLAFISAAILKFLKRYELDQNLALLILFFSYFIMANIVLAFFNLLPIPPLDGSKIFLGWINRPWIQKYLASNKAGLIIVIVVLFILPYIGRMVGTNLDFFSLYLRETSLRTLKFIFSVV